MSVARPSGSGTEEIMGSISLPSWRPMEGGWPALSLLFANNADSLIQSVVAFGIPVARETDLLRASREQIAAMKDPPHPYYKTDKRMGMKRHRQTYAWVHKEGEREVWVEKDSFLPLKIVGPCPESVLELGWVKSGENQCEVDFRNVTSLRRGNPQNSRVTVWKDGAPVLFFSFDRVVPPKSGGEPAIAAEMRVPPEVAAVAAIILH
jgi:hypothetical protein